MITDFQGVLLLELLGLQPVLKPLAKLELFKFVRKVIMFECVVIPNLCQ